VVSWCDQPASDAIQLAVRGSEAWLPFPLAATDCLVVSNGGEYPAPENTIPGVAEIRLPECFPHAMF
jgi:hypothetical protein